MHRTHFLRKGFELSHSKMLFHDPVQITRRFVTPYLELALNIDYSAAWSVDGFRSEREHGGHVQLIYMNDVKIHAEMPASKEMITWSCVLILCFGENCYKNWIFVWSNLLLVWRR
ncbi:MULTISPECIES: hypothetical protein [unclassified Paenibacillus]|uniref:hypothetical protein n=1 Tax=unclassified Paenibacillus TaxID=185978 RepID=UPI00048CD61C|nr:MULTISPECIES: hypothetical protein [unclassified Paenibacillus]